MAALKGDDHVNDFCSVTISGCKANSDCGWCKKVWNAAIEHAEKKFKSTNNASHVICADTIETNNMCDYCKEQSTCDSEHINNVACGYFVGRKLQAIA